MALANGTRLGPYEIVAPLGAGGMGEVYRARDTRLDRTVAIKILPPHFAVDVNRRQRFEREAKVVSSLNHPNICTLHDVGQQDGVDFIVMEYLEGESLAARLEKGPLPAPQVLQYGIQVASALDKAHRNGVTHRDLKPGNIILTKSGAKLLDFGLAKAEPAASMGKTLTDATPRPLPMTKLGTIIGTVPYMSPEQLEGKEVDARSDIFSLGAVLYERISGPERVQRCLGHPAERPGAHQHPAASHPARPGAHHPGLSGKRPGRTLAVSERSVERAAVDLRRRISVRSTPWGTAGLARRSQDDT
jgi:serine/threonine protein kinase